VVTRLCHWAVEVPHYHTLIVLLGLAFILHNTVVVALRKQFSNTLYFID